LNFLKKRVEIEKNEFLQQNVWKPLT
jgi:hypothetical protein